MITHHIQRKIMHTLMHSQSVRFKDLKPDGMESNIFMYHLKQLIKEGYVQKTDDGYGLTATGLTYVDPLNVATNVQPQPKPIVIVVVHDGKGRWLLAKRKIQPYLGSYMLISNNHYRGKTTDEHIAEQLRQMNVSAVPMYKGHAEIVLYTSENSEVLLTHVVGSVYEIVLEDSSSPYPETEQLSYEWVDTIEGKDVMPGTRELVSEIIINNKSSFFFSNG